MEASRSSLTQVQQPLYPLSDSSLTALPSSSLSKSAFLLAKFTDFQLEIYEMSRTLENVQERAPTRNANEMTWLQKSARSLRNPNFLHSIAAPTMAFLENVHNLLKYFNKDLRKPREDFSETTSTCFKKIFSIWWTLYTITDQTKPVSDTIQVVLEMAREFVSGLQASSMLETRILEGFAAGLSSFQSNKQLTTGLSMKRLWPHLRPITAQTMTALEDVLQLENLADRMDSILWQTEAPLEQQKVLKYSITNARLEILKSGATGKGLIKVCVHIYIVVSFAMRC